MTEWTCRLHFSLHVNKSWVIHLFLLFVIFRLVQSRRASHSHFQLIIITHDTGFVEQLRRSNVAEYFNYVHKDDK